MKRIVATAIIIIAVIMGTASAAWAPNLDVVWRYIDVDSVPAPEPPDAKEVLP